MSSRASRALVWMVVAVCLGLVAAAPASAQIYAIRDENGVLTLSDKPLGAGAQTYAVRGASSTVRATRGSGDGVRSSQWDDVIDYHAREQGVRPDLVRAVIQVESAFNPRARSHKGAMGLMQLMPGDGRATSACATPTTRSRTSAAASPTCAALLDQFNGNEELALAAYNAGAGAVNKYGGTVPPYRETRDYVSQDPGQGGHQPRRPQRDLPHHRAGRRRRGRPLLEPEAAARHHLRSRPAPPRRRIGRRRAGRAQPTTARPSGPRATRGTAPGCRRRRGARDRSRSPRAGRRCPRSSRSGRPPRRRRRARRSAPASPRSSARAATSRDTR